MKKYLSHDYLSAFFKKKKYSQILTKDSQKKEVLNTLHSAAMNEMDSNGDTGLGTVCRDHNVDRAIAKVLFEISKGQLFR